MEAELSLTGRKVGITNKGSNGPLTPAAPLSKALSPLASCEAAGAMVRDKGRGSRDMYEDLKWADRQRGIECNPINLYARISWLASSRQGSKGSLNPILTC
jgi:hypothetical protein